MERQRISAPGLIRPVAVPRRLYGGPFHALASRKCVTMTLAWPCLCFFEE